MPFARRSHVIRTAPSGLAPACPTLGAPTKGAGTLATACGASDRSSGGALQRARGEARIAFAIIAGRTRLARLYQDGAAKIRLPRPTGGEVEAVLINSAGGLTGGDAMRWEVEVGGNARAVLATQAAEKIYRALAGTASVETRLAVAAGARLDFLPQETILFDGARLSRSLRADLAAGARLLVVEPVVFGRQARGEQVATGAFRESWRVRREGRLVFADDLRLEGRIADTLARPAALAGGRAMATALYLGEDAETLVEAAREAIGGAGGASAFDGKLVARMVAPDGLALRAALVPLLACLRGGAALPRVWTS